MTAEPAPSSSSSRCYYCSAPKLYDNESGGLSEALCDACILKVDRAIATATKGQSVPSRGRCAFCETRKKRDIYLLAGLKADICQRCLGEFKLWIEYRQKTTDNLKPCSKCKRPAKGNLDWITVCDSCVDEFLILRKQNILRRIEEDKDLKAILKGYRLTVSQSEEAERKLALNPDSKDLRLQLIAFYFDRGKEFAHKRAEHLLWLITTCPFSKLWSFNPVVSVDEYCPPRLFARLRERWLSQVNSFPYEAGVAAHAGIFILERD